jgi:hypothetical protein
LQELAIRAGFLVAYNIGNHSKPLFWSQFLKQCIVGVAEALWPKK